MDGKLITESQARFAIANDCYELARKAQTSAGELIAKCVWEHGDDYEAIFRCARTIIAAYCAEITYIKAG